ncbi:LysM peptidoglycan-binding domain-containing protein [Mobilitalea sibirica]|uniref:LysM peptidoglycan-binding domain-containing protein n=1 Tax=Mobilitalea sibirica TaxID=1462919 RepID=A0A8J7KZU1_9FIRM|nr:LysM peptidoglycan-binding domain-containing protein [Mobilitalea sibirica]MBH1940968.1 LysM peptidoglycan-binding domain-containing protein [Mobilitalea sibirica]
MNNAEKFLGIRFYETKLNKKKIWLIGFGILIAVLIFSLYFFSKTVTAQRDTDRIKMVTSIEVKQGDSLWSIAASFMTEEYNDIHDYIEEIKSSNGLLTDTIRAGNYIIVPYYADASR